ncbi:MAG TPA: ABC transporter permease [Acetobacteraceae bacterium]|jgi:ABC-2 type transport system permease protein|nr:ABC transporter permease [Acetobacteraceae bacterium]
MKGFSWARLEAMLRKEWQQMRRDPMTIGLTVMLPLLQLFLFGFAINTNPHHLPTGLLSASHSEYERSIVTALQNTGYFDIHTFQTEHQADEALARGDVLFVLEIPPGFARAVSRGQDPSVLLDADATDPVAIGDATAAVVALNANVLQRDLPPNMQTTPRTPPFTIVIHNRYNPEQITALNIVPGLIGTILLMSTLVITTLSITRERETGTMENLLAMPVRPVEVMLGKIVPYVGLGYVQVMLILTVSALAFHVPVRGSILLLLVALGVFIAGNLAMGILFSTIARTQQSAQQLAQFSLLPSMMLSGFMFPFQGMPGWARGIGELLPLTHILRICRGVLLKGNTMAEIVPNLWPMAVFAVVVSVVAVLSYRETLD